MSGLMTILIASAMQTSTPSAPAGFGVAAETRNFVFYAREGAKVDAGKSQRFLDETAKQLGVEINDRRAYYRYAWAEEVAFALGSVAAGASGAYMANGDVHSSRPFDAHEIVHRAAYQLGNPGPMFQEGLAVELGDNGRYGNAKVDDIAKSLAGRVAFRTLADRFASLAPEVRYPLAGSFVRFLVRRHGLAKVSEFFRSCGDRPAARDAQFAKAFGQSLDEAGALWQSSLGR